MSFFHFSVQWADLFVAKHVINFFRGLCIDTGARDISNIAMDFLCVIKVFLLSGPNLSSCPGLIPSSRESWRTACLALKVDTGGILHLHDNLQITSCSQEPLEIPPDLLSICSDIFSL